MFTLLYWNPKAVWPTFCCDTHTSSAAKTADFFLYLAAEILFQTTLSFAGNKIFTYKSVWRYFSHCCVHAVRMMWWLLGDLDLNQLTESERFPPTYSEVEMAGRDGLWWDRSWIHTAHLVFEYFSTLSWVYCLLSSFRRSPVTAAQPPFTRLCLPGKRHCLLLLPFLAAASLLAFVVSWTEGRDAFRFPLRLSPTSTLPSRLLCHRAR